MPVLTSHLSVITLNINGVNSPIKRYRVAGWIKNTRLTVCCLQETHLSPKDKHRLQVKGWEMILQANGSHTKTHGTILMSDKIDFKFKEVTRERWTLYDKRDNLSRKHNIY